MLNYRRIWNRIHTSDKWIRIRIQEAQKRVDPVDPIRNSGLMSQFHLYRFELYCVSGAAEDSEVCALLSRHHEDHGANLHGPHQP